MNWLICSPTIKDKEIEGASEVHSSEESENLHFEGNETLVVVN